jgi:hypothetical protein
MSRALKYSLIGGSIVLLLALIGVAIYFGIGSQAVVTVTGSYTCPNDYRCIVTPVLHCENSQVSQKVVLRWSNNNILTSFEPEQLAFDSDGDGDLDRWTRSSTTGGTQTPLIRFPSPYDDAYLGYYNSHILVCHPRSGTSGDLCRVYNTGGSIPIDITPVTSYQTQGLESYSGDAYSYVCSQNVYIDGALKERLDWSSNSKTPVAGKRGSTYTIYDGAKISGQGTGVFKIEHDSIFVPVPITTCTAENGQILNAGASTCIDVYTAQKCTTPPQMEKQFAQEGQVCKDGIIAKAYDVGVVLERDTISAGETFDIAFTLSGTTNNKNIPITASIIKGSQVLTSSTQLTGSAPFNAGKTDFTLDAPPIGYYTLRITFPHPDGDYKLEKEIRVTDSLNLILKTDNPIQFDNERISVTLESFKAGDYKDLKSYEIDATYNGAKKYPAVVQSGGIGRLIFLFDLKGDGTLRVKARGSDESGLLTEWTDYKEVTVKKATILFETDFQTDKCTGTYTNSFTTKDSTGALVETSNSVLIERPLSGETGTPSVSGSAGKYSFTYNFDQQGLYVVRLTSTHPSLGVSQLNGGTGQTITILGGASCGGGGGTGDEGINWTMWLIIGGLVVGIGFFLYIIFWKRK